MNNTSLRMVDMSPALYSHGVRIVLASLWIFFTVMGLVGSNLVIWSVILSKKLRTVTNAFVVNLSVADFWTTLSYPWMAVAGLSGSWPLGSEVPCIIAAVQFNSGLGVGLYVLATIAMNRLLIVTQTLDTYRWLYSPRKVAGMIAATWVIPFAIISFPLIGVGKLGYDPYTHMCSDKEGHSGSVGYNLAQTVGLYPVPMIVIIGSYTALYIHLKKHFRAQTRRNTHRFNPTADGDPSGEGSTSLDVVLDERRGMTVEDLAERKRRTVKHQQLAITKNLFLVCCVFTTLVSPYYLSIPVSSNSSAAFTLYGALIATLNSCVNPIIYTANHPQFKVVLRKMILCRYSEIPEPSDFLKYLLSRKKPTI